MNAEIILILLATPLLTVSVGILIAILNDMIREFTEEHRRRKEKEEQ